MCIGDELGLARAYVDLNNITESLAVTIISITGTRASKITYIENFKPSALSCSRSGLVEERSCFLSGGLSVSDMVDSSK